MTDKQPKPYINCPEPLLETAVEAIEQDYVDSTNFIYAASIYTFSRATMELIRKHADKDEGEYVSDLNTDERYMLFCWILMSEGRM